MLQYITGRHGEKTEFVEFKGKSVSYIAQYNGDVWYIYRNEHGRNGNVRTISWKRSKDEAATWALEGAITEGI